MLSAFFRRLVWRSVPFFLLSFFIPIAAWASCTGTDPSNSVQTLINELQTRAGSFRIVLSPANFSCVRSPASGAQCARGPSACSSDALQCCIIPSTVGDCVTRALVNGATVPEGASTYSCRALQSGEDRTTSRCLSGGCSGSLYCCPPATAGSGGGSSAPQATTARGGTQAAQACAQAAIRAAADDAARTTLTGQIEQIERTTGATRGNWYCSRVCSADVQAGKCIDAGCPNDNNTVKCCVPDTGPVPSARNACPRTPGAAPAGGDVLGSIQLPACVTSHEASTAGKCSLTDILNVGIAFANFLLGLAGAVFLGIFVLGGVYYILFSYDSGKAQKGKEMIKNATVGLLIMLLAGTMVRFAKSSIGATEGSGSGRSSSQSSGSRSTSSGSQLPASSGGASCHCTATLVPDTLARTVGGFEGLCNGTGRCTDCGSSAAHCTVDFSATATECTAGQSSPWSLGPRIGLTEGQVAQARDHVELRDVRCTVAGGTPASR